MKERLNIANAVKALLPKGLLASIREFTGQSGMYYRYGREDNVPNLIVEAVNDSPTARLCRAASIGSRIVIWMDCIEHIASLSRIRSERPGRPKRSLWKLANESFAVDQQCRRECDFL